MKVFQQQLTAKENLYPHLCHNILKYEKESDTFHYLISMFLFYFFQCHIFTHLIREKFGKSNC